MTNRRRGIFIGLLLAVLASASLAVAVAAYIQRLPDPDTADRRGLFRWLVECDLREQPVAVQLVIMRRVEEELLAGVDFREVASMLNDGQRKLLLSNADLLARCWFHRAADSYFAAPVDRRDMVLGQQLEQLQKLGIMEQLSALEHWSQKPAEPAAGHATVKPANSPQSSSVAALASQAARVQQWLAEAEPQDRYEMSQYFTAVGNRLLADKLKPLDNLRQWLPKW